MININPSDNKVYGMATEWERGGKPVKVKHRKTRYKPPEDFPQWEEPKFDIKKALREIMDSQY